MFGCFGLLRWNAQHETFNAKRSTEADMDKLVARFAAVDIDGDGEVCREEIRTTRKANKNRKGASK